MKSILLSKLGGSVISNANMTVRETVNGVPYITLFARKGDVTYAQNVCFGKRSAEQHGLAAGVVLPLSTQKQLHLVDTFADTPVSKRLAVRYKLSIQEENIFDSTEGFDTTPFKALFTNKDGESLVAKAPVTKEAISEDEL